MKTKIYLSLVSAFAATCMQSAIAQTNTFPTTGSAGIGTTTPNASSLMEMASTSKGLLIPRMTKNQRDAIASPATGLMIYQTNSTPGFYYFDGSAWQAVSAKGVNKTLSNLDGATAINADLLPNAHNALNFGSPALGWKDMYLGGSIYSNSNRFISKDSTNTWIGLYTGLSNTGTYNNAFGNSALYSNTSGSSNTAVGNKALYSNTIGIDNTANGSLALYFNTTGSYNIANGSLALYSNITGSDNIANGPIALYSNTTGYSNIAIGRGALFANTTGYFNTAIGDQSLFANTTGNFNTANGANALYYNTTGYYNTANGYQSLYSNTNGYYNTANGYQSLYSNTTGPYNTANGYLSLYFNTTGDANTANGVEALYSNTTGYSNTANGIDALRSNTTGYYNSANGAEALFYNTEGFANTANGVEALHLNTTGNWNTANGFGALQSNTTGDYNTADGDGALALNTTGNYNTALGYGAGSFINNLVNSTAIGARAVADANNKVRIGDNLVTKIGGQVSWTTFSDGRYKKNIKEDVKGLAFINSLRPITYTVDINGLDEYYDKGRKHDSAYEKMKAEMQPSVDEAAKIVYNGFIAQDVETAAKKLNYDFSGVDKPQTKDGLYGLRYSDFVVPLVKAVQELSKQNDDLKNQKDAQQKINADLQKQIDELKAMIVSGNQLAESRQSQTSSQQVIISSAPVGGAGVYLEQNIPNPFASTTTIHYTLPQKYTSAKIIIADNTGKVLKQVTLSGNGKGSLNIDASTLLSGAYNYSLYIDGKLINSKQMVLAK